MPFTDITFNTIHGPVNLGISHIDSGGNNENILPKLSHQSLTFQSTVSFFIMDTYGMPSSGNPEQDRDSMIATNPKVERISKIGSNEVKKK